MQAFLQIFTLIKNLFFPRTNTLYIRGINYRYNLLTLMEKLQVNVVRTDFTSITIILGCTLFILSVFIFNNPVYTINVINI